MSSKELERVISFLKSRRKLLDLDVREQREHMEKLSHFQPAADVVTQPVVANSVPAEWITAPGALKERVILYLHGGGYVSCSINTHRELVSRLSRVAHARALAINYRLAPENPFPAALDDACSAYRWILSGGVKHNKVTIVGDSAGAGLAVATLIALRDAGDPLPAAAVCMSPWVDMEGTGKSMVTNVQTDLMVTWANDRQMSKAYVGELDMRNPLVSPIYANLKGLPPLLIQVSTTEVLLDDSVRLHKKAKADGVDAILEKWEEMIHVWQLFAPVLPEGQKAIDRIGEFIIQHTST